MSRLAVLVPLLLVLCGCGSMGGFLGTAAPAASNICVLTVAEIDQYWGWPDTIPEPEQSQDGPTCGYRDSGSGAETTFRLNLVPFSANCEQLRTYPNSTAISGIGEWAYWSQDRLKMYAKLGDRCFEVIPNVPGSTDVDFMTGMTELARLAAGRL